MNAILRFWSIFTVTARRLLAQRGLALATTIGLVVGVAITMSIPIYADAIYQRIFKAQVETGETGAQGRIRPPYAFMFRYIGSWSGPIALDRLKPLDSYLTGPVVNDIGLPMEFQVAYFRSEGLELFPSTDRTTYSEFEMLDLVSLGTLRGIQEHINILEGSWPPVAEPTSDSIVEVMVHENLANNLGLQIGEEYTLYNEIDLEESKLRFNFPVRISGIWNAKDPKEAYWFYSVDEFKKLMVVPEDTYSGRVAPFMDNRVNLALWYLVLDGSQMHSSDIPGLLSHVAEARQKALNLLQDVRLDVSPIESLTAFYRATSTLTIFLYALSVPILLLILVFISLVVDMAVARRQNEIAVLRSRGATTLQIIGMAALEGAILGVVGLAAGIPSAQNVSQFFGRTRSFLDFSANINLPTAITSTALMFGFGIAIIGLLAQVIPSFSAARHTIITYKQTRARNLRAPWWQRAGLDFLLFIPTVYGGYLLRAQGGGALADPFQNPLLMLVPALGIFAATLFILRILPIFMAAFAWIASRTKSVGILLAARHLSRTAGLYSAPLILLVLTLSLSTYTATLAQTLDRHLHDQSFYKVGADMNIVESGESTQPQGVIQGPATTTESDSEGPLWYFLPVSEHLKVPGVQAAARVAETPGSAIIGSNYVGIRMMGIDRVDFSQVAFWRADFAQAPLGSLMNNLALTTEGVLVPRSFLEEFGLKPGDSFRISLAQFQDAEPFEVKIVGVFELWPTWYPSDGPMIIGNLDHLFERAGTEFPYNVWLKVKPGADYTALTSGVRDLFRHVFAWDISTDLITKEQELPQRQGLFGLLSVGFIALALLTVLGFLLYALFSFQRRFVELGMLRAIGLSAMQMILFLASELAFVLLTGLAAGTGLGVAVSNLFIPYLQIGGEKAARIPPYLVAIDWGSVFQIYILFGLLFIVALTVLGVSLLRMKIFQAVKLGESV